MLVLWWVLHGGVKRTATGCFLGKSIHPYPLAGAEDPSGYCRMNWSRLKQKCFLYFFCGVVCLWRPISNICSINISTFFFFCLPSRHYNYIMVFRLLSWWPLKLHCKHTSDSKRKIRMLLFGDLNSCKYQWTLVNLLSSRFCLWHSYECEVKVLLEYQVNFL